MAKEPVKKSRVRKPAQTVRERSANDATTTPKRRPIRRTGRLAARPLKAIGRLGMREYYLPVSNTRVGRFLNKRRYIIPRYFREAWTEVRQVVWPGRRETFKLTLAVFTFAIIFGLIIAVTDYGLDKLFRKVLLR